MKPAKWDNLPKIFYWLVSNPDGRTRTKQSETKFGAIALAMQDDNNKFTVNQYKVRKCFL